MNALRTICESRLVCCGATAVAAGIVYYSGGVAALSSEGLAAVVGAVALAIISFIGAVYAACRSKPAGGAPKEQHTSSPVTSVVTGSGSATNASQPSLQASVTSDSRVQQTASASLSATSHSTVAAPPPVSAPVSAVPPTKALQPSAAPVSSATPPEGVAGRSTVGQANKLAPSSKTHAISTQTTPPRKDQGTAPMTPLSGSAPPSTATSARALQSSLKTVPKTYVDQSTSPMPNQKPSSTLPTTTSSTTTSRPNPEMSHRASGAPPLHSTSQTTASLSTAQASSNRSAGDALKTAPSQPWYQEVRRVRLEQSREVSVGYLLHKSTIFLQTNEVLVSAVIDKGEGIFRFKLRENGFSELQEQTCRVDDWANINSDNIAAHILKVFESGSFKQSVLPKIKDKTLILCITNDGWFGNDLNNSCAAALHLLGHYASNLRGRIVFQTRASLEKTLLLSTKK